MLNLFCWVSPEVQTRLTSIAEPVVLAVWAGSERLCHSPSPLNALFSGNADCGARTTPQIQLFFARGCWSSLARLSQLPGYSSCSWFLGPLAPGLKLTAGLGYLFTSATLPGDAGILGMDRIQTPNLFDS